MSIVFVLVVIILFPSLQITAVTKNIVLAILLLPWIAFIISLLFLEKISEYLIAYSIFAINLILFLER
ncbi:spore germination protein [Francisella orientalis str. Toba 04]|nr:spore germination protein [Francisella orientalis str. Toba 04]